MSGLGCPLLWHPGRWGARGRVARFLDDVLALVHLYDLPIAQW